MEKKRQIKKKLFFGLDCVFGVSLFIAYRIGIEMGAKWACVLLLVLSVVVFEIGRFAGSTFLKVLAVGNILYSVLMLTFDEEWWNNILDGKLTRIIPMAILIVIGVSMSRVSGIFVLAFGILVGMAIPYIPRVVNSFVKGPLPNVQSVVKGSQRVHLFRDNEKRQTELIYRYGHKKKILDIYPWEEDIRFHASIEWKEKDCVIVRSYSMRTYKVLEEKRYKL